MSSLFVADLFTDKLIDRRILFPGGSTSFTGVYGVLVPDGINVGHPPDVSTLIASKYAGLQQFYGFQGHIFIDENFSNVDTNASSPVQLSGKFGVAMLLPPSGSSIAKTPNIELDIVPTQAVIVFDMFYFADQDVAAGRFTRSYVLPGPGDTEAQVVCTASFNGGNNFITVPPGSVFSIPTDIHGPAFVLQFTRTGGTKRLFIGSWAVLYQ